MAHNDKSTFLINTRAKAQVVGYAHATSLPTAWRMGSIPSHLPSRCRDSSQQSSAASPHSTFQSAEREKNVQMKIKSIHPDRVQQARRALLVLLAVLTSASAASVIAASSRCT